MKRRNPDLEAHEAFLVTVILAVVALVIGLSLTKCFPQPASPGENVSINNNNNQ